MHAVSPPFSHSRCVLPSFSAEFLDSTASSRPSSPCWFPILPLLPSEIPPVPQNPASGPEFPSPDAHPFRHDMAYIIAAPLHSELINPAPCNSHVPRRDNGPCMQRLGRWATQMEKAPRNERTFTKENRLNMHILGKKCSWWGPSSRHPHICYTPTLCTARAC